MTRKLFLGPGVLESDWEITFRRKNDLLSVFLFATNWKKELELEWASASASAQRPDF